MKRFSEQFHKKAQSVSLQAIEREELRQRVYSYMEYHPLPESRVSSSKKRVSLTPSQQYPFVQMPLSLIMKWSAVTAAVVLVIVPMLAERSVPGDSLYAIKVQFNEEVISTLKLSPYEKVEWETERLNRRIAEARLLASEGKLTDEVEAEIATAVKEHTEAVQEEIEVLRAEDADQATLASIELSTTLQVQSDAFVEEGNTVMALAMTDASSENPAQMVVDAINESLTKQDQHADTLPSYDKIMARVEINTTRAYELLQSLKLNTEDKLYKDAQRRLDDVGRTIEKANGLRGQNEEVAQGQLLDALQRTQKIIVFMSDAEVSGTTDIEAIVPIVYTDDEFKGQLGQLREDINRKIEIIKTLTPQVSANAAEKAAYAIEIAESNEAIIASSTEPANAVNLAKESATVLGDAIALFETEGVSARAVPSEETVPTPEATTTPEVTEGSTPETEAPQQ
ncbi:MAG: hypothetical protein RL538_130 [Candidatus Parcubacteria bacterium]|jgi:hypothetical protein